MKNAKIIFGLIVLVFMFNLNASVRINGLGSYFEYLIPDTETDVELFPSHLSEYESKYVQVFNNYNSHNYNENSARNINFSIKPLSSKFNIRINADIASNNRKPRIYLEDVFSYYGRSTYFDGSEYGTSLINNSISYNLSDNLHLGCFIKYGVNWQEDVRDELEQEELNHLIIENSEDYNYDDDYLSAGINFRLLSNYKTDIAMRYSKNTVDDFFTYKYIYERFYDQSIDDHFDRIIRENLRNIEWETEDVGLSILVEKDNTSIINRLFLDIHYIQRGSNYKTDYLNNVLYYVDNELDFERKDISEEIRLEDTELYTATLGFGKAINKEKLDMFYGVKIFGMYGETARNESYYMLDYRKYIDPDSIYTDSTSVSGVNSFDIKDWKVAIEVPFGASYKLNGIVQLFGGMGLKLIRQKLKYFEENEFSRWETDRYFVLGSTITPLECLEIDVNYGSDFSYFKTWQLDLKYLW